MHPHMIGSFVKAVLRVVVYLETVRDVCLGLEMFELHGSLKTRLPSSAGRRWVRILGA